MPEPKVREVSEPLGAHEEMSQLVTEILTAIGCVAFTGIERRPVPIEPFEAVLSRQRSGFGHRCVHGPNYNPKNERIKRCREKIGEKGANLAEK